MACEGNRPSGPVLLACASHRLIQRANELSLKSTLWSHSSMPRQNRQRRSGFTLIEVMMASTILVVGFIGMIQAMTIGSGLMDNARRQTLAAQILSHHIEKLRQLPWDVTTAAPNELAINDLPTASTTITIDSQFSSAIAASGATYTLSRTVADVVSGSLREATFTVTWVVTTSRRDSGGAMVTFTYTRIAAADYGKYGLNLAYQR